MIDSLFTLNYILNDYKLSTTTHSGGAQFITFIAIGAVDKLEGCLIITEMDKEDLIIRSDEIVAKNAYKINVKDLY